ncbi:MAG TPA: D-sedoheptulose 7-phosphate isomerase [Bacteroidales bacterium]|nr:D-sedoheptulose 7-phosphate isomerase [Bacteroidales bacterium]
MRVIESIKESIEVKQKLLTDSFLISEIRKVAVACTNAFSRGNKVLLCGNGGSAADAQHIAAEFSGRFNFDRPPLPSEALHVNTSFLTAVANDYSFDEVYARLLKGLGREGDVLVGLSTSGNSPNVIRAFETAREMHITTVGFTGMTGGQLAPLCDFLINIPSTATPRIQESHIMVGHIICEIVESNLFPREA